MDEESFTELAETEGTGLAAYLARRTVAQCDVEELAQESLALVWRLRERIQPGKESPFLYGVASRLLQAYWRKQGTRLSLRVHGLTESALESQVENGSDALQFMPLMAREETDRLRQILAQLPERQREVIESIYFQGRTLVATAEHLHVGKSTVATHHQRALRRLRQLLATE